MIQALNDNLDLNCAIFFFISGREYMCNLYYVISVQLITEVKPKYIFEYHDTPQLDIYMLALLG